MLSLLGLQPFHYAVDVETMRTSSPDKWTIVSGTFAIRTTPVEGNPEKKQFFERFYDFFLFFHEYLQIPQVSSLAIHFQEATPFQPLTVTFNLVLDTNCEI